MQWKIEGKARPPQRQWVPRRLTQGFSEEASKQGRPVGGGDLLEVQDDPIHAQLLSHPHAVRASWREIQHHHDSQSVYFTGGEIFQLKKECANSCHLHSDLLYLTSMTTSADLSENSCK